jgi:phospholipase C
MPPQTLPTIGDRLSGAGVSWAWYAGGWNNALVGNPAPTFEFHHQPFVYFEQFADGTPAKAEHLKDEDDFVASLDNGSLPEVSFIKPVGEYDEHAGYSTVLSSEQHTADLIEQIKTRLTGKTRPSSSPTTTSVAGTITSPRRWSIAGDRAGGCRCCLSRHTHAMNSSITRSTTPPPS